MSHNSPLPEEAKAAQLPSAGEGNRPPQAVPTRAQLAARRQYRRAWKRARNPLAISWRWLLLTVALSAVAAFGAIALFFGLRNPSAAESAAPIAIVTAGDLQLPLALSPEPGQATADPAIAPEVILAPGSPVSIVLTGPAVPTVIVTNTPIPLALGLDAEVHGVGDDELNVRNLPALRGSQVLFRAPAGSQFVIIGGPEYADGYTWWQLHDPAFEVSGWAVARYLQALPESSGQEA